MQTSEADWSPLPVTLQDTSEVISTDNLSLLIDYSENGQCFGNAYKIANEFGAKCVEGIVIMKLETEEGDKGYVIAHCWNKLGDLSFDVTKDFVWANNGLKADYMYCPVNEYNADSYVPNESGEIEFKSDSYAKASLFNKHLFS